MITPTLILPHQGGGEFLRELDAQQLCCGVLHLGSFLLSQNFLDIQKEYLQQVWGRQLEELEAVLPARQKGDCLQFQAFGEPCELRRQEIFLGGERLTGPEGILIAMYASYVPNEKLQLLPLKSFKELPDSMPYQGAFSANAEHILLPHVSAIRNHQQGLAARFSGNVNPDPPSGDFSFTLYSLPRIPLYYIFYLPDEEFPAAVSCLFSANVIDFLPLAGLADVAEYTSKKIIEIITEVRS